MGTGYWGVALGNFDGVHIGHRVLLDRLLEKGKDSGLSTLVFTFKQHPQNVLLTRNKIPLIYPPEKKKDIILKLGIDMVEMVDFTQKFAMLEPEEFFEKFLLNRYNIKYVVVGFNYRFGRGGKGNVSLLKQIGDRYGFEVQVVDPVITNGEVVSSSLIRKLISIGDIKSANRLLGRKYTVNGKVVKGKGRGKEMGFPTANIELPPGILYPSRGVYITITNLENASMISLTNVGINPTFSGNKLVIETYIPGFKGNLYDKYIEVEFLERIRDEKKFESKEELVKQIEMDLKYMENYVYSYKV